MERNIALLNGDQLVCTEQAAVFHFSGSRAVLSTAANGGGLRYDLTSAFNYCDCGRAAVCRPMDGRTLQEHQAAVARRLGLDPDRTTGLDTAANLDNMVIVTKRSASLWLTAAVSAGADVNALCAGDRATLTESAGVPCPLPAGTINLFLITDQALAPGAMAELLLTATEAKTAVLRDLMQGSSVSHALATGTGTDGVVIICGTEEEKRLLNAGKHFKFGEIAAAAVKEAVSEALFRQTGLCPQSQHTVLRRLRRFGITAETLSARCRRDIPQARENFLDALGRLDRDAFLVTAVALYIHLIDQCETGLLTRGEAEDWADHLLREIQQHYRATCPVAQGTPLVERMERFLSDLLAENLLERENLYSTGRKDAKW